MQSTPTSLSRPARLMCRCTITAIVKINPTTSFLFNSRWPRVPSNPYDSTRMLNVDEGVAFVDNNSKILQI